jgi:hypothetical protein
MPTEETAYCKRCRRETRWIAGRGGRFSRCEGCHDRFPCSHECKHLDCRDAKAATPTKEERA